MIKIMYVAALLEQTSPFFMLPLNFGVILF